MSEYPHSDSGRKNAKIIKVKKWSEFFDFDEFENGMEHMKKPIEQVTELSEEEGSDSEPSVDNYNQKELGEFLGAALDLKEGEANPFDEPEISLKSGREENNGTLTIHPARRPVPKLDGHVKM